MRLQLDSVREGTTTLREGDTYDFGVLFLLLIYGDKIVILFWDDFWLVGHVI